MSIQKLGSILRSLPSQRGLDLHHRLLAGMNDPQTRRLLRQAIRASGNGVIQ